MKYKLFLVSLINCIIFMLCRGSYFFMQAANNFINPLWWIFICLLMAVNVMVLCRIRNSDTKFHHVSVISGIAAGAALSFAISFLLNRFLTYGFLLTSNYLYGMYMYDGIDSDNVYYIAQTAAYIYLYNILSYIIVKYRKPKRNVYTIVIHNSRGRELSCVRVLIGAERYAFDTIDNIKPQENIKKDIVLDDIRFLSQLRYPYDIILQSESFTVKIGNLIDDKEKAVYADFNDGGITLNNKLRKKIKRNRNNRWFD